MEINYEFCDKRVKEQLHYLNSLETEHNSGKISTDRFKLLWFSANKVLDYWNKKRDNLHWVNHALNEGAIERNSALMTLMVMLVTKELWDELADLGEVVLGCSSDIRMSYKVVLSCYYEKSERFKEIYLKVDETCGGYLVERLKREANENQGKH
jgi:hypothetical protein